LPQVAVRGSSYSEMMARQVSQRHFFTGTPFSAERLSRLLIPFRYRRETVVDQDFDFRLLLRPYASPARLHQCEMHRVLIAVKRQARTICHHDLRA